eukprot:1928648-Rhodomonas_salina.2
MHAEARLVHLARSLGGDVRCSNSYLGYPARLKWGLWELVSMGLYRVLRRGALASTGKREFDLYCSHLWLKVTVQLHN